MIRQLTILVGLTMMALITTICHAQPFRHYITKDGDRLYEGEKFFGLSALILPALTGITMAI